MCIDDAHLDQPVPAKELAELHQGFRLEHATFIEQLVHVGQFQELGEGNPPLDVEVAQCELLGLLLLDVQAEELLAVLGHHEHVGVLSRHVLAVFELVGLNLFHDFLEQALLPFGDGHVLLLDLLDGVEVVGDAPLVHVGLVTALHRIIDAADERLIHDVLVAQIWQLLG